MLWLGIGLALATSVSWAIGNVLIQRVGKLVGPPRAMLWSMASGALLASPCASLMDSRTAAVSPAVVLWIATAAISGVIAYVGLFFAFANERLSIAVPLVSSWPLVAAAVSVGLLGEVLRGAQLFGGGVVLAGAILVSVAQRSHADAPRADDPTTKRNPTSRWALHAAFASALGFGVMVPAMGRVAPSTGAFGATVIVFVLGIALAASIGAFVGTPLSPPPRRAWGLVLATGAAETAGFVTVALARRFAPMALVAPIASLSSTLTVVYAWLVLGERPRVVAAVGALLAGVGIVILAA